MLSRLAVGMGFLIALVAFNIWLVTRTPVERLAKSYVDTAFQLDQISSGEVDNYFGNYQPDEASGTSLEDIIRKADALKAEIDLAILENDDNRLASLRDKVGYLSRVLGLVHANDSVSFAQELSSLFRIYIDELSPETELDNEGRVVSIERALSPQEIAASEAIVELNRILPGQGSLPFRVSSFKSRFMVPVNKREQVFEAALKACEENTKVNWELPLDAGIQLNWTREVSTPWHVYLGNGESEILINPLAMSYMGAMIDVACHEGYPGHHAQYVLIEQSLIELDDFSEEERLMLLRTPRTAVLEGAADYGIGLTFPRDKRLALERDVLFPIAGLDTADIEKYLQVNHLVKVANNGVLRTIQAYADEMLPDIAAAVRLENNFLIASPRAFLNYVDRYGAYSAIYSIASSHIDSLVAAEINSQTLAWDALNRIVVYLKEFPVEERTTTMPVN